MKQSLTRNWPHFAALAIFVLISIVYFYPAVQGYVLRQPDILNFKGMAKEIFEFRKYFSEEPLWTNSMFGGMPAFQISVIYPNDILGLVDTIVSLGLPRPINYLFLYLFGFYILLVSFKVKPWLAVVGAVAFAFSSYYFIILEAGHNSKAHAIAYMAPTLAGIVWAYRGKLLWGGALTALFLALQINANHVQITYYFGIVALFFVVAKLVETVRKKEVSTFVSGSLVLLAAAAIAVLSNADVLWNTYEYSKHTTRGTSELTIGPDGLPNEAIRTTGLDREYVTQWSQGIGESWTFLIPNAYGGGSGLFSPEQVEGVDPVMRQNILQSNTYWGDQPFTSGPVYMGAAVILLFLLGAFFIRTPLKWALLAATLLTVALAWGKNFMGLTNFFLDFVPGYNKFRAVTIILAITEMVVPLLGFLFLKKLFKDRDLLVREKKRFFAVAGGLLFLLFLFAVTPQTFFDFLSERETLMINAELTGNNADGALRYAEALKDARASLFTADAWRSFFIVAIAVALTWFFSKGRMKEMPFVVALGVLILVDLWGVDKRYLNNQKERGQFVSWEKKGDPGLAYTATEADKFILDRERAANPEVDQAIDSLLGVMQQKVASGEWDRATTADRTDAMFSALRFNTAYRVLNLNNPFSDSRVSYFHSSLGGYHGAKLQRIQEVYDFHIQRELSELRTELQGQPTQASVEALLASLDVIGMMNVKYLIYNPQAPPLENPDALGAAWFVSDVRMVEGGDEEITLLGEIDPENVALVDRRYGPQLTGFVAQNSGTSRIELEKRLPNYLRYRTQTQVDEVAVFSEIYYDAGWQAYLDGQPVDHFRANYLLRGMRVPEGEHVIEFKFEPEVFHKATVISTATGFGLILLLAFAVFKNITITESEEESDYGGEA